MVNMGRVTAGNKQGESVIIVRYQGAVLEIPVTISNLTVRTLTTPIEEMVLELEEERELAATATFSDKSSKDVTDEAGWSSSDSKVLTISDEGEITAQKSGTSVITATYGGKRVQIRILVVNEKAPKYLRVSRSSLSIKPGQEVGVTVTAFMRKAMMKRSRTMWNGPQQTLILQQ